MKISAALAAGNMMGLKPSPHTPLSTLLLGAALNEVLVPPRRAERRQRPQPLGKAMAEHRILCKVTVTGRWAPAGRWRRPRRATSSASPLELGGNDPAILLPDADVDAIADDKPGRRPVRTPGARRGSRRGRSPRAAH